MSIKIGNISCNDKLREFKQYIDSADRIILSAQFGDGKTFFLQKVREDKEIADEYKIFTLYPVNYQVAQNEDIFECKRPKCSKAFCNPPYERKVMLG